MLRVFGLDNKLYKMHGTYINLLQYLYVVYFAHTACLYRTAIISLKSVNYLVFVMETERVWCEEQTEFLC
jgi:hypothetical protein